METKKNIKKQKIFFLLFASLLILSIFSIIIKAEENSTPPGVPSGNIIGGGIDPETGLPNEVVPLKKAGDTMADDEKRTAYLKAEWQKILEKNQFWGPIVKFIERLDPISNFILGIPIAFSWYFFLTLVIWVAFVVIILRITTLFEIKNKLIHYLVAIGLIAAISYFRYPKSISGVIVALIILQKIWWIQYIIMGIVIGLAILGIIFSKQFEIMWKKIKEKNKKRNDILEKDEFHNDVKMLESFRKEMSKP